MQSTPLLLNFNLELERNDLNFHLKYMICDILYTGRAVCQVISPKFGTTMDGRGDNATITLFFLLMSSGISHHYKL